ncbi:MAG: fibronectin type III domain-containing protein [Thaumarchaeota archaeon]|nr:MAG: fibronectin type III domain-containing protein [Nitrososphaerota archaeon]
MNKSFNFLVIAVLVAIGSILIIPSHLAEGKTVIPTETPTDLVATPASPSQIDLSWNAPTQNYGKTIVGYKIEERLSSGAYYTLVDNTGSTLTTYSITGLKTGTTYTYRVSAVLGDSNFNICTNNTNSTICRANLKRKI